MELPTELLLLILDDLGSTFFRRNIRCLTVSRRWYRFAWQIFVRDLRLTASSVRELVNNDRLFQRCRPYIVTVELFLNGIPEWRTSKIPYIELNTVYKLTLELNMSLALLAGKLQQTPGLRYLKLKAGPENPALGLPRRGYLDVTPLAGLLSIHHLTSLEFDTAGSYPRSQMGDPNTHLCSLLNSLIPSLQRLRCRMDNVCESLLDPPTSETRLKLEDLIINLSLSELSEAFTSYRYPKRCHYVPDGDFPRLKERIEKQATALVSRLENPRVVRVLSHEFPSLKITCFDAITGRRMWLKDGSCWDADGIVIAGDGEDLEDETDPFDTSLAEQEIDI
jgi:hypothetical protein